MRTLLALVVLLSTCCLAQHENYNLLEDVLKVVAKALDFFAEDYSAINVDGLFGLRLGQGQLRAAIKECQTNQCDTGLLQILVDLEHRLDVACNSALPYVKDADPAYYARFEATVNKPYELDYTPIKFPASRDAKGRISRYDEERGDRCYGRMMGTFVEGDRILPKCNVTDECFNYMTKPGTTDYFVTHQLLYFIMTEHVGCKDAMETYTGGKRMTDIQTQFCKTIYNEATLLENDGNVNSRRKDLFLEQTLLCGVLGYEDFMRPDWIRMVLTWPDRRIGCFKSDFEKLIKHLENDLNLEPTAIITGSRGRVQEQGKSMDIESSSGSTMRKLLRERHMKDGCLSHTSGLGFGVLSTYLRYIVRYL